MHSGHNKSHIRLTKFPTDTPLGVGARFIVPVSLHCQIRIFTSSNTHIRFIATHFHIIKYAYSFHRKQISVRHIVDIYGYAGTINRPLRLLTVCQQRCWRIGIMWKIFCEISTFTHEMRATDLQQHNIQKTKTILLQCKNPLFARQKPYFYTAKTILLFCEYVTYTE